MTDWLSKISDTAGGLAQTYATVKNAGVPQNAAPAPTNTANQGTPEAKPTNWLLIGGIAAALLAVVFFFTRK